MATATSYPLRVEGHLDSPLSRWLWLVKWLLAIPHYVLLAFLWIGFVVTSVIAFFAILFTGRYPRVLFEYNVGVLRWTWRVSYYTYGALGTDRYPPFTLDDVPDYPARLEVAYPEHLSRGLVLLKWWLLAIPHYIIIGLFLGGASYVGWQSDNWDYRWSGGLIDILVLVAAVVLAITGNYPRSLYDLVLGLNRWVLRVAAYAGLMTDRYPPFRLDMGGDEPGTLAFSGPGGGGPSAGAPATAPPATSPATAPPAAPSPAPAGGPSRLTAGRAVALVVGAVLALISLSLLAGGFATLIADRIGRDDGGFLRTDERRLATATPALVSEGIDLNVGGPGIIYTRRLLGDVEVRVDSAFNEPVFIGIAERADAAAYLDSFRHDRVLFTDSNDPTYRSEGTGRTAQPPEGQSFWAAATSGTGPQTLRWQPTSGDWVVVVMNADGAAGVEVRGDIGAELPVLSWVWIGLLVAGGVLLLGAAVPIALAVRR